MHRPRRRHPSYSTCENLHDKRSRISPPCVPKHSIAHLSYFQDKCTRHRCNPLISPPFFDTDDAHTCRLYRLCDLCAEAKLCARACVNTLVEWYSTHEIPEKKIFVKLNPCIKQPPCKKTA